MELGAGKFVKFVTTAGITIAISFVGGAIVFANSKYHTSQREGAWGVLVASSWLEIVWFLIATTLVITRWKITTSIFRTVFVFNMALAVFLISDALWFH